MAKSLQAADSALSAKAVEEHNKVAVEEYDAAAECDADRILVEPERLELDGYKREKREGGTVSWRGLRDWPAPGVAETMTDEEIAQMVGLPKTIVSKTPAKGYRDHNGHRRCDVALGSESVDEGTFSVFP